MFLFSQAGHVNEALEICSEIIKKDPNNVEAFCDRADAYIFDENYDEGIN